MQQLSPRTVLFLLIDVALLIVCLLHIPQIRERATLPVTLESQNGRVIVSSVTSRPEAGLVESGDRVLTWGSHELTRPELAEFLADLSRQGERIVLTIERGDNQFIASVTLIPYYPSFRFLVISLIVGFCAWGVGVFVLFYRSSDLIASTLHWMLVALGVTIMITWGAVDTSSLFSYLSRSLFFVAYVGTASTFLFFALNYPTRSRIVVSIQAATIFGIAFLLVSSMVYYHLEALRTVSVASFESFQRIFDVFRTTMFLYAGAGILRLFHSLRAAHTKEERERLQWLLWGMSIGAAPFLLLHILPQLLFSTYIIAEEYATIGFLAVPFSFAISFVKYRLLDVEVVINRSVVYAGLSVFVVVVYALTVVLISTFVNPDAVFEEYVIIIGVTVMVGTILNPLRRRLQHLIDETFFPVRMNFRKVVTELGDRLHGALSTDQLFTVCIDSLQYLISFETIAAYRYDAGKLHLQTYRGAPLKASLSLRKEHHALFASSEVFAVQSALNVTRDDIDFSHELLLRRLGCSICLPLLSETKELLGVLAARPSMKNAVFSEDEIDLLRAVSTLTAEVLDRLNLQEQMLVEQEERRRAEQLSRLKSDFVSYVSHEFQNPLTSIKLSSLLLKREAKGRKMKEFADLIEGEADRLSNMVASILDAAKIEQGLKEYSFEGVDCSEVVRSVLKRMSYQIEKNGFRLVKSIPRRKQMIFADPDAVSRALVNLVSNALKYGRKGKYLRIAVDRRNGLVVCKVKDRGQGMDESAVKHLFEKFYRDPLSSSQVQGVGLGLSLVKHIMEAHGGDVTVRSAPGKGTTFTLSFPEMGQSGS